MASFTNLPQVFARLSEREKRLVLITSVVAVVLLGFLGVTAVNAAVERRGKRVAMRQDELAQLDVLRDRYRDAEEAEKKSAAQIRSNSQSLFSVVQKAATEVGLPVPDLQERRTPAKDSTDVQEVSVDVNVKEISVDKLTTLLEKIEGKRSDGVVKVTKLKVKTRFDNADMLEASLTVSTWRSSSAAPPADGAKP
ncbi:MAG: type II secretion system protein M [Deltaproteobacteria bacterium]|nr:type II secretion system protein M [Deltaproteobacteria bacterium]